MKTLIAAAMVFALTIFLATVETQESTSETQANEVGYDQPATSESSPVGVQEQERLDDEQSEDLFKKVSTIAQKLASEIENLDTAIQEAFTTRAAVSERFDSMVASVVEVLNALQEGSDIQVTLEEVIQDWGGNVEETERKAVTNPDFADIVAAWKDKVNKAKELRKELYNQHQRSMAILETIERKKEVALEHYRLRQADKVLEVLTSAIGQIKVMNEEMSKVVGDMGNSDDWTIPN